MFLKGLNKLLSICILIFVTGCVTNEQKSKDLAKVNHGTSSDDDIVLNSLPKEVPDFFVVAEIKSVNDQPIEFLEFKLKRFAGKNECQTWMSNNSTLVADSLYSHILKLKKGYFIDSIKCLKTGRFLPKTKKTNYSI